MWQREVACMPVQIVLCKNAVKRFSSYPSIFLFLFETLSPLKDHSRKTVYFFKVAE